MPNTQPLRMKTISEFLQYRGLPKAEHPLICVLPFEDFKQTIDVTEASLVLDFYFIALKRNFDARMKYGQQQYDFDEGLMTFLSPGQVFRIEVDAPKELHHSGWMLLVHSDFLWNTPLAKTIKNYEYFDYAVAEALFLSEKEEATIIGIMQNIAQEYRSNIDRFSHSVIIAQLELLLTYAERFYQRQFITRRITNHKILQRLEEILAGHFNSETLSA